MAEGREGGRVEGYKRGKDPLLRILRPFLGFFWGGGRACIYDVYYVYDMEMYMSIIPPPSKKRL